MISDVLQTCPTCGVRPVRLAVAGEDCWRVRCGCGTRIELIFADSKSVGEPVAPFSEGEQRTLEFIQRLLARSRPAAGTLVESYLRARGIGIIPDVLHFVPYLEHRPSGRSLPAMLAAVVGIDGEVRGLHRTYLQPDGKAKADVEPAKMMLGHCNGGAVRLAEAGRELAVAEGIETALSVLEQTGIPTWAALSTSGLISLELPPAPLARAVTIMADNDAKGQGVVAAKKAAARWFSEGRRVRIAVPPKVGTDFNDVAREEQSA